MDKDDEMLLDGASTENTCNWKLQDSAEVQDEDDTPLPGFRFHPTDEELVGFYLRRKVEKKPIRIELIKHIDIYKYDPWDLPKGSDVGDKEWYFFCRRGRKYRNSIRPNRVTSSGFWKATGIDRPIYSERHRDQCVGLKKSLVYYRGSAGKGTKTDWMMHEFRLPPPDYQTTMTTSKAIRPNDAFQEAEVWTLCRILKRNTSPQKILVDTRHRTNAAGKRNCDPVIDENSKTCSDGSNNMHGVNISFQQTPRVSTNQDINEKKPGVYSNNHIVAESNHLVIGPVTSSMHQEAASSIITSYSNFSSLEMNAFVQYADWEELRSFAEFAGCDQCII